MSQCPSSEFESTRVSFDFDWGSAGGAHVRDQVEVVLSERWSSELDKDGSLGEVFLGRVRENADVDELDELDKSWG